MSYRIEVTAASLTELGGKLLALASQFHTTPVDPVMPEIRETAPAPAKAKKAPAVKPVEEVVVAVPEPHTSETSAPTPDTSSSSALKSTEQPAEAPSAPLSSEPSPSSLDFDKDITPLVLRVVAEKSRETVIEILGQFGAARASEVPEAQWPELLNALTDAL